MDPFSADSELATLHTHFIQSQYLEVISYDTSSLSSSNQLAARVLKARSKLALGQTKEVISETRADAKSSPELQAVLLLAQDIQKPGDAALADQAKELAENHGDSANVLVLTGTLLARAERREEALAVLSKHEGSLDAVALTTQIHLLANRPDLAASTLRAARAWAQDALLVNLAESWVGLRTGGAAYQAAFYVFEELATQPSTTSANSHLAQSVCELHLGRLPESEAALGEALKLDKDDEVILQDAVALYTVLGKTKERDEMVQQLEAMSPECEVLKGLQERRDRFEGAMGKYKPVFEPVGA